MSENSEPVLKAHRMSDDEVTAVVVSLAQKLDDTGCPVIVVSDVDDGGVALNVYFPNRRARALISDRTPTPEPVAPEACLPIVERIGGDA